MIKYIQCECNWENETLVNKALNNWKHPLKCFIFTSGTSVVSVNREKIMVFLSMAIRTLHSCLETPSSNGDPEGGEIW